MLEYHQKFAEEREEMLFHDKSKKETLDALGTDESLGLSSSKIPSLQEKYGENKLKEKKKKTM